MTEAPTAWRFTIYPQQVRAARALIDWSQDQLVRASNVRKNTIARFELGISVTPRERNVTAIRTALEAAGVVFIDQGSTGPGVCLRHPLEPSNQPGKPDVEPRS